MNDSGFCYKGTIMFVPLCLLWLPHLISLILQSSLSVLSLYLSGLGSDLSSLFPFVEDERGFVDVQLDQQQHFQNSL